MDLFFNNLKEFFKNKNFIFLKNNNKYKSEDYIFVYETIYENNKYTVFLNKNTNNIKPIISICIPTFNKNNYVLLKALEEWEKSKNINLSLVEFVIVENGTKTYNYEILKKFNLNINLINIEDASLGKARRISVENANSNLLLLVNDDTIPTEFLIQNHIKYQIENYNKNLGILGTFYFHNEVLDTKFMNILKEDRNLFFQNFFEDNTICDAFITNNISIKKEYIIKSGNFSDNLKISGDDQDLENRLSENGIKILFKLDLISYHYHKHDINSYINLLKNRYYLDIKISLKYGKDIKKIVFEMNKQNLISASFFLNYLTKNYNNDLYLKSYLQIIHYTCLILIHSKNENFENLKLNNLNNKVLIVILGEYKNKIYQSYKNFEIKNITKQTELYSIIKNYDYFLFTKSESILLPYSIELFLLLSENIDSSYKIILGKTYQKNEQLEKFIILENTYDLFIKKEYIMNPLLLEKNIDENFIIDLKNTYKCLEIDIPCTSLLLN